MARPGSSQRTHEDGVLNPDVVPGRLEAKVLKCRAVAQDHQPPIDTYWTQGIVRFHDKLKPRQIRRL